MLTTAADYTYNAANLAADYVDIQGRIIPTEDIASQPHPLRRENLAYLCEMICERLPSSQMASNPFWSVPAQHGPVAKTEPSAIGAKIRDLYSHNASQTSRTGATQPAGYFPPSISISDFSVQSQSNSYILRETFASLLADLSDCAVPSVMPSALSADYLRACFYSANALRVREYGLNASSGTTGGTRHRSGYAERVDADGNITTSQISNTAAAPGAFSADSARANGYYVDVGASTYNGYAYAFYDPQAATSPNTYADHYELWYAGASGAKALAADLPSVFGAVKVMFLQAYVEQGSSGATGKYVLVPVAFTATTSAGGDLTLTTPVDQSFWRGVVSAAYPGASYTPSGSGTYYAVRAPSYLYICELAYPSLLPSGWTWTP